MERNEDRLVKADGQDGTEGLVSVIIPDLMPGNLLTRRLGRCGARLMAAGS